MQLKRTHVAPVTPGPYRHNPSNLVTQAKAHLPSSKQIAWMLVRDADKLGQMDRALLEHLQQDPEVTQLYALAQYFVTLVKHCQSAELGIWLAHCDKATLPKVQHFALGIRQDYAAVRAAHETNWSNGQTKEQVNRLKFIKRQMFGRAHFDPLRLRVLHPP